MNRIMLIAVFTSVSPTALVLGLILVGCITIIGSFGTRVFARWNSTNSSF